VFPVEVGGEVLARTSDTGFSLGGLALRRGKATLAPGKTRRRHAGSSLAD
jgi:hypothetical protein